MAKHSGRKFQIRYEFRPVTDILVPDLKDEPNDSIARDSIFHLHFLDTKMLRSAKTLKLPDAVCVSLVAPGQL